MTYTPVEVAVAADGTPVFGFETVLDRRRAADLPVEFEFVVMHGQRVQFALKSDDTLVGIASEADARDVCRRLVEYEEYDVAVRFGGPEEYDEITRQRLAGEASDRLYQTYRDL